MKTINKLATRFLLLMLLWVFWGGIFLPQLLCAQENPAIIELGQLENNTIRVTAKIKPSALYRAYDLRLQYKLPTTKEWKNTKVLFKRVNKKNNRGSQQSWTVKVSPESVPWDNEGNIEVRLMPVDRYKRKKVYTPIITTAATTGLFAAGLLFRKNSEETFARYERASNSAEARSLDKANSQFRTGTLMYYGGILTGIASLVLWWKAKIQDDGLRKIDTKPNNQSKTRLSLGGTFNIPQLTLTVKF